jgi:hypothetical protein
MSEAKIQFSGAEMELMNNATIILTKNIILQKIKALLEEVQNGMLHHVATESMYNNNLLFESTPKISRGENYEGLPYVVLDYPRQFELTDIFVIRTMFWWGNLFSITLQLSGKYRTEFGEKISDAYASLVKKEFFIGVGEDPWQHHFEEDNYQLISKLSEEEFKEKCMEGEHLKIARNFPLWDVHFVAEDLLHHWQYLLSLCND